MIGKEDDDKKLHYFLYKKSVILNNSRYPSIQNYYNYIKSKKSQCFDKGKYDIFYIVGFFS